MATRTLSQMRTRIMRITGQDSNDTELTQIVDDYINRSYQDILRRHKWNWLRKESILSIYATVSTGTVSVSGSQLTGTSTSFSAAHEGWYIQLKDLNDETYRILDVTSSTSLTLEGPVSTAVSTSEYLAFKVDYALPLGLDEGTIEYIVDTNDSRKLYPVSPNSLEYAFPNFGSNSTTNAPECFSIVGRDNDNKVLVRFYPIPDEARTFRVVGFDSQEDLATGNDSPLIPERFQEVIEEGALARIYAWQGRADLQAVHTNLFETYIKDMMRLDTKITGIIYPREENDVPKGKRFPNLTLPAEYGKVRQ